MQLYREYLGPVGSMTVVSLSHFGLDLVDAMVSILTIGMWATNCHFTPRLCRCISVSLTVYLSYSIGATRGIAGAMVFLELYAPTFGDIIMPADGLCLYHCFNYALSGGAAKPTEMAAMRFRAKVVALLRRDGHSKEARRLLEAGEAGYPDEEDFPAIAAVAGFSFSILQDTIRDELVYASELGPVRMTVRRHYIRDGSGKLSPHFDIVSYDPTINKVYEELRGAYCMEIGCLSRLSPILHACRQVYWYHSTHRHVGRDSCRLCTKSHYELVACQK